METCLMPILNSIKANCMWFWFLSVWYIFNICWTFSSSHSEPITEMIKSQINGGCTFKENLYFLMVIEFISYTQTDSLLLLYKGKKNQIKMLNIKC